MKSLVLFSILVVSQAGLAATLLDGESTSVTGSLVQQARANTTLDDKEIIEMCGTHYPLLKLDQPIQVEVLFSEGGKSEVFEVSQMSVHGDLTTIAENGKGKAKVFGSVFHVDAGICNEQEFGIVSQ